MTSKLLMVLITLVAVVGYLALAIWGAGGIDAFFSEPVRIALALVGFALGIAALFSSGHIGAGKREDRGNSGSSSCLAWWACFSAICPPTPNDGDFGSSTGGLGIPCF